jgi:hypothetical protein
MKSVTITIGDYDLKVIEQIFEKESKFSPNDPRDELMIEVMRQVKDNPKVDLGADEADEYQKAESRFSSCWGEDGKPLVKRETA